MAIVRGSFTQILQPGLRELFYAGQNFTHLPSGVWAPSAVPGPQPLFQILHFGGGLPVDYRARPRPNEFQEWEDYLVALAEWEYGFHQ